MVIGIPRELLPGEDRVALVPAAIAPLVKSGAQVVVERGAGVSAGCPDDAYTAAGARLATRDQVFAEADVLLQVRTPGAAGVHGAADLERLGPRHTVIGFADPLGSPDASRGVAERGASLIAMELIPRITRAQSMDALSSMANIGGYKAVLLAAATLPRLFPMMMTAAGTISPARVFVIGAGVAGLQAIATAKRLGAVIEASDVRPAVKEQIESLGAKFVDVPFETDEERECAEGVGGYARPMPASWMARQAQAVHERAKQADIIITTALIPGRKAPTLLQEETVQQMKPGSVVIDLAASQGGNCPLTEADQVVVKHGVTLVGYTNLATLVPADASALYARNLLDFLKLVIDGEAKFQLNLEDDIVAACLMCRDGQVVRTNG